MIYKLRQDIMRKLVPHLVEDDTNRELLTNILNCRKSEMGFVHSCITASTITGEDITGLVMEYERNLKEKRQEAEQYGE
jgi:hypothetical protein